VLALVLLGLLVDDLVVAAETHVCAGHLASAEEGVHPAAVDVDVGAIAQLDVSEPARSPGHRGNDSEARPRKERPRREKRVPARLDPNTWVV
jgi:hypothetical protein